MDWASVMVAGRFFDACSQLSETIISFLPRIQNAFFCQNYRRDVSAMSREHRFLKTERYLFISILFAGICHHPDNHFVFLQAGGRYG